MGFPTLCQGPRNVFIYLFIRPRERFACHVVSIWRSVSRKDWIPTSVFTQRIRADCTAAISLLSCGINLEKLYGISYLFPGIFCFQGKGKLFSIFTGSLRALAFQFCCGTRNEALTKGDCVCALGLRSFFHNLWLVNSWSCAPDRIQMYPDRDTIAQLLPARRIEQHVMSAWLKMAWSSARAHVSLIDTGRTWEHCQLSISTSDDR